MKKLTSILSIGMATAISTSTIFNIPAFADTYFTPPRTIQDTNENVPSPYYLYLQSVDLSINPSSSEVGYVIFITGSSRLKSVSGTITLYKQNSSGSYEKKASRKHSFSGSFITEGYSFDSYGPGNYKITFDGIAYSTTGGQESFSISATNSY